MAGAAPGSIIAAIIDTHSAAKNADEPSSVATPMYMPCICRTATPQAAAASPSVAASAAAVAAVLPLVIPTERRAGVASGRCRIATALPSIPLEPHPPMLLMASNASVGFRSTAKAEVNRRSGMVSSGFLECGCGGLARGPAAVVRQRIERVVPIAGQRGQELLCHLHRCRTEPVPHPAPLSVFGRHQADLGQQGQVFRDCLPRNRQAIGQVGGRR